MGMLASDQIFIFHNVHILFSYSLHHWTVMRPYYLFSFSSLITFCIVDILLCYFIYILFFPFSCNVFVFSFFFVEIFSFKHIYLCMLNMFIFGIIYLVCKHELEIIYTIEWLEFKLIAFPLRKKQQQTNTFFPLILWVFRLSCIYSIGMWYYFRIFCILTNNKKYIHKFT